MAIDDREDGMWAVTTDEKGRVVQTNLYTGYVMATEPNDIASIEGFGARTAAQIQHSLRQGPQ